MTSTSFDDIRARPPLGMPPVLQKLWRKPHSRDAFIVTPLRAAVLFVPTAFMLAVFGAGGELVPEAMLITAIWFLALRSAHAAASLSPLVLGVWVPTALGSAVGFAAVSDIAFLTPVIDASALQLVLISLVMFAAATTFEAVASKKAASRRRVLAVGAAPGACDLIHDLADDPNSPFECVGVVSSTPEEEMEMSEGIPVLGTIDKLNRILIRERPDLVVLCDVERRADVMPTLLDAASLGFRVVDLHHFYEHAFGRVPVHNLSSVWFMSIVHLYQRPYSRVVKRTLDVALAGIGFVAFAPVIALLAVLVRCSSPGPILFRQVRLGQEGRTFEMLKFRTMVDGAETPGTAVWAEETDPRITRIGRVLRRTRLDELPQLWNVLRGDMSIVGPRPERPEFVELLEREVPFWTRRHLVKPGVTGWAQVRNGYTSDIAGTADKLSYDLYYIKHRSLLLDLAIVAKTVGIVLAGRERLASRRGVPEPVRG